MIGVQNCYYHSDDKLKLFYRDYCPTIGEKSAFAILCMHGLTRNSRDFEDLAVHLAAQYRVLAADFRGRGYSAYDQNHRNYHSETYVDDMIALLDHADVEHTVLIGTSLGGLVSMVLAHRLGHRVAGVILNDIGPEISPIGLARIQAYVARATPVTNWAEAVVQLKNIYEVAWPGLSDEKWETLVHRSYREDYEGVPRLDMDPMIGKTIRESKPQAENPWGLFSGLAHIPTLVFQGANSDILTDDIVAKMQSHNANLQHVRVPDRGHVPLLDEPQCVEAIDAFLAGLSGWSAQ